jgi:hypothetical protein
MNPNTATHPPNKNQKYAVYAALDLHCGQSLLGSMDHDGNSLGQSRFPTDAEALTAAARALGGAGVCLTLEANSLTRWAAGLVRPLVDRLVICEPRHNRLVNANPTKKDEEDVAAMCLLLRVNKLHEVWMGEDRGRQIHRELVYELLNWRDAQRELKALIKARYRQWGVLRVEGTGVFSRTQREDYLAQLPGEEESASLSLGTRVEEEEEKFKARTSNFEFSPPLRRRRHRRPEPLHDTALRVVQTHALRRCPRQRKRPPRPSRIREVGLAAGGVTGCERHYPESGNRNHGLHG